MANSHIEPVKETHEVFSSTIYYQGARDTE
jgi:hypothetical protein